MDNPTIWNAVPMESHHGYDAGKESQKKLK